MIAIPVLLAALFVPAGLLALAAVAVTWSASRAAVADNMRRLRALSAPNLSAVGGNLSKLTAPAPIRPARRTVFSRRRQASAAGLRAAA